MARVSAIGLMSGTSYDGVDVALLNTDGEDIGRVGPTGYRPYSEQERAVLRRAIAAAVHLGDRAERPKLLAEAEELVTDTHAEAVEAFLAANGMSASEVKVVGFHGQTVLHRPDRGLTVQLGDGPTLAARLGIPVVYDFRAADVAAGGQGAPVVPVFHRALVRMLERAAPGRRAQCRRCRQCDLHRRRRRHRRLRHRSGQRADRRLSAPADQQPAGRRRARRRRRPRRRGRGRARADASLLCQAAAEIARPQHLPPVGRRAGRARRQEHRGWRRHAHRHHRGRRRARDRRAAASARELDRRRRRHPQPDPDADAGAARWRRPRSRPRARSAGRRTRSRRRPSPIWRCARSTDMPITFPSTTGVREPMKGGVLVKPDAR